MASLDESLSLFRDSILDCIKKKQSIMVTTHNDCDGLTSGSIIIKALIRAGAQCTLRVRREFNPEVVKSLKVESREMNIITDLGGGFAKNLNDTLGDRWFVLDHHQIPQSEMDNANVINAWRYDIDGGTEICAGGMAYNAALALDEKNRDLSPLAIIAALGDRQDAGDRKSLVGRNFEIAETAKEMGLVEVDMDLLLVGRETRPLSDALAFTSQPFIEGLTWNRDVCFALLNSSKISLKDGNRWRVPAELNETEKKKVIESIAKFAAGKDSTEIMAELIGYTYTFPNEDDRSFLRDGREFATMLNSCGRIERAGVGIAICIGDRDKSLSEGEEILVDYRSKIRQYMNILANERWRTSDHKSYIIVNGENVVPEMMTGTISSLLAGSPKHAGKIVILMTRAEPDKIKFSSRKSFDCKSKVNLSELMRAAAEESKGVGGGHAAAAGAKITKNKLDEFLKYIHDNVGEIPDSASNR